MFFIVYFATLNGVRALDAKLVQTAQIIGASERQVARHIVMPAAVPSIFAGFRIAVPYGIAAAVIAELISANRGLGYLVQTGAMNFDTTSVFVAVLMATLLVQAATWMMNALERWLLRWRPPIDADDGDRHVTALLEIRKLGKRFPARHGREPSPWVIQDLSFSVADGEFLTIVGPSGAGKSTLLNIIAQTDTASAGEILFDGTHGDHARSARAQTRHRAPHRLCDAGRQPAALALDARQRAVLARSAGQARRREPRAGARR